MVKIVDLRRSIKQLDGEAAAFRGLDREVAQGLRELAIEPLIMLRRGDPEGAWLHIKSLRLDSDEMMIFWSLFDSTQRRVMKETQAYKNG